MHMLKLLDTHTHTPTKTKGPVGGSVREGKYLVKDNNNSRSAGSDSCALRLI